MRIFLSLATLMALLISCNKEIDPFYRESMREFIEEISQYSKTEIPGFIVIPQNGHELVSESGEANNDPVMHYLEAIDGAGQEDLFYGYSGDNRKTSEKDTEYLLSFLEICETNGVEVLVSDYCNSDDNIRDSYEQNEAHGFISFAAIERELNIIPEQVYNENKDSIFSLSDARNFLYLINPEPYASKADMISAISETNYDLLIIDLFVNDEVLMHDDIALLKTKANGGSRLVICYMSIGEAEDYRYYWESDWNANMPDWIEAENSKWEGNYKVRYWNAEWQAIIMGSQNSYLDRILSAGFDGVYLDIIEAFEYFE